MMKKIYITGICGMLGYYLSQAFSYNFEVSGCDLLELNNENISFKYKKLDLTDFGATEAELRKVQPDVIVHTVAYINVDLCEEDKERAYLINSELTKNLVNIADSINAKLIYISTDAVFDGELDKPYAENDLVNPINVYGKTKLKGEEFVIGSSRKHLVLRTNIYGWNIQKKNSFAEWVYYSLKDNQAITMFSDLYYSPIYVGDFYNIIDLCIEADLTGLYHAAGGEHCSKYDFAIALAEEFSLTNKLIKRGSFRNMSFKAPRSPNMRLNSNKIQKVLNTTLPGLKEGLRHLFKDKGKYDKL